MRFLWFFPGDMQTALGSLRSLVALAQIAFITGRGINTKSAKLATLTDGSFKVRSILKQLAWNFSQ